MSLLKWPSRYLLFGVIVCGLPLALASLRPASGAPSRVALGGTEPLLLAQANEAEIRYRAAKELYDHRQFAEARQILADAASRFPDDRRIRSLLRKVDGAIAKAEAAEAKQKARETSARKKEIAAHLSNGDRALKRAEYERARAAYQSALTLDPENGPAKAGLARVDKAEAEAKRAGESRAEQETAGETARAVEEERQAALRAARELAAKKDYAGAVKVLEEARLKAPHDRRLAAYVGEYRRAALEAKVDEHVARADALAKEGRHQDALAELQAARALDPDDKGLKKRTAKLESEMAKAKPPAEADASREAAAARAEALRSADGLADRKDYAGAIAVLEKLPAAAQREAEVAKALDRYRQEQVRLEIDQHVARADSLSRDNQFDDALTELQAAQQLDPRSRLVRRRMADVQKAKARYEAREAAAKEAEARKPEAEVAEVEVAEVEVAEGEVAEVEVAEVEVAEGEVAEGEVAEGEAAEAKRRETEAAERKAAEAKQREEEAARERQRREIQQQVDAHLTRAEQLIKEQKYQQAREELAKVRELQPGNRVAGRLEGEARLKEQAASEKADQAARAKELEQKRADARKLVDQARAAYKKGDYAEAMRLASEATKLDAQNQDAVAVAREAAAKKVEAERQAEVSRVQQDTDRRLAEAQSYLDRKDYDGAIEITKQVLLIDDGNQAAIKIRRQAEEGKRAAEAQAGLQEAESRFQRAQVFFDQNDWDAAEAELRQGLQLYPQHADSQRLLNRITEAREKQAKLEAEERKKREAEEAKTRQVSAQEAFQEGQTLYEQGDIIGAYEAWERAVQIDPAFEAARTFMERTEADYQKALAIREQEERKRAEDAEWEAKLDQVIGSFEISTPTRIETVLTNILGVLSGFNFIVGEGVTGEVEVRISDKTLRDILDLLLIPNGFAWRRETDTILVTTKFQSRVFPLTPEEYKKVKQILEHPESLQNPNLDLRRVIYGEAEPQEIPGRELRLNAKTQTLIVRDSATNIGKVEAWLAQLEDIVIAREPYIYRSYPLKTTVAKTIYEMVRRFLVEETSGDEVTHREEGKRLIFDEEHGILVILDTPENIEHVEQIILRQDIIGAIEEGVLKARVFRITDDTGTDPEAVFRRLEVIRGVVDILRTMLYEGTGETEEEANARGRRIFYPEAREQEIRDPRFIGTITVVDTEENLKKIQEFLGTVGGTGTRNFYVIDVKHRDIVDLKLQLDRATGRVRDVGVTAGYSTYGDIERELQVRALIVEDAETHQLIVRADDPTIMDEIQTVVELLDRPVDQVEIESRLIQVSVDDIRSVGLDWTFTQIGESGIDWSENRNSLNLITDAATSVGATYRTIGPTQLSLVLNLISTLDSAEVLSAPKITVVSSPPDPATIEVITEEPVVTSVDLDTKGDDDPRNDTLRPNFDVDEVGITLEVTPTVLGDGYVVMDIAPEVSTVVGRVPIVVTGEGASQLGALNLENLGPLIIDTSTASTRIRVKDGDTIVIGGLVRDQLTRSVNSVPILGQIPLLGNLFRDEATNISKETLLIFVTVHVIKATF